MLSNMPVDTQRRFNVYKTTSYRRLIDVETTSCVYWDVLIFAMKILGKLTAFQLSLRLTAFGIFPWQFKQLQGIEPVCLNLKIQI